METIVSRAHVHACEHDMTLAKPNQTVVESITEKAH